MDNTEEFFWGASISATQTEGFHRYNFRGVSIWDEFLKKRKIDTSGIEFSSCDFVKHYEQDILKLKSLGFQHFRFSISWAHIQPLGEGMFNNLAVKYYKNVILFCKKNNIEPWITLYHWDLPENLEKLGGWSNRLILHYFEMYVKQIYQTFGTEVKNWIVLNEPSVFTAAGYLLGIHAPGKKGLKNYLPALHHSVLAQSIGINYLKKYPQNYVGTSLHFGDIAPYSKNRFDQKAANQVHTLMNRMFLEPLLGMGYPKNLRSFYKRLSVHIRPGDDKLMQCKPDFIGAQIYTRHFIKYNPIQPYLKVKVIKPKKLQLETTAMGWENYPNAVGNVLNWLSIYENLPEIVITENGIALEDEMNGNEILDNTRIEYLEHALNCIKIARQNQIPVRGYFVWSLLDNFEWMELFRPRFGIIYVDFKTKVRTIKHSGYWLKNYIKENLKM